MSQDLIAGFDPTGQSTITAANLLVLIQAAYPNLDRGMCVVTDDVAAVPVVPDAVGDTKLKRYIWVRRLATSVIAYVWNDTAVSGALLKWQSISLSAIAPGSITNIMLAPGSVTDDKIVSLSWSKITGPPSFIAAGDAAGGDLTGTYPDPVVGNNKITSAKLQSDAAIDANRAVGPDHIKNNAVEPLRQFEIPAQAGSVIMSSADSLTWNYDFVKLLQHLTVDCSPAHAPAAAGSVMNLVGAIPQITQGVSLGTLAITAHQATNHIRCSFRGFFTCKSSGGVTPKIILALFKQGTAAALQATVFEGDVAGAQDAHELSLSWQVAAGVTTAQTFEIRFGVAAATEEGWFNENDAGTWFSGTMKSQFVVEEFYHA